uniref:Scr1 family TA system antitoxin-like transcriptional regulator n=1 Tax=Streptomyces sp. CA-136453 TaxID=3240050 RepID=UPI003F4944E8
MWKVVAMLDEAVLRRPMGGPEVMCEQLPGARPCRPVAILQTEIRYQMTLAWCERLG